jgi:hypothetical protein
MTSILRRTADGSAPPFVVLVAGASAVSPAESHLAIKPQLPGTGAWCLPMLMGRLEGRLVPGRPQMVCRVRERLPLSA